MRATVIRRGILGVAVSLAAAALVLSAGALGAKPTPRAHFKGRTAAPPVVGFYAPVTFTVSPDGSTLRGFTYGSLGCFGAGGFRPGVSPYTGGAVIHVGAVRKVAPGRFAVSGARSTYKLPKYNQTTVTTVAVKVHFTKARAATGSITFSQTITGSFKGTCGPTTIGFTATGH